MQTCRFSDELKEFGVGIISIIQELVNRDRLTELLLAIGEMINLFLCCRVSNTWQ